MRDYRSEGLVNETLLAVGPNPGEPCARQLVREGLAAVFPLDLLLRKVMTLSARIASAEDANRDGSTFWEEIAEELRGPSILPVQLTDAVLAGVRLTNP